jgi:hypothetical protein
LTATTAAKRVFSFPYFNWDFLNIKLIDTAAAGRNKIAAIDIVTSAGFKSSQVE